MGHLGVALTFGLVVMAMIFALGHVSGAHFNPAVSIAFAVGGHFPWRQVPAYLVAQCGGALLAAIALRLLAGPEAPLGETHPSGIGLASAFGLEFIITFFLMFVIVAVATDARAAGQAAAIAIGGTVTLCALFAGPFTGASMNPARSLGPALAAGTLSDLWLYLCAPVAGAIAATLAYRAVRCDAEAPRPASGCC